MSRRNQLVIPLNLEKIVEVSASVRTLDEICESLDYTKLYNVYQGKNANTNIYELNSISHLAQEFCLHSIID